MAINCRLESTVTRLLFPSLFAIATALISLPPQGDTALLLPPFILDQIIGSDLFLVETVASRPALRAHCGRVDIDTETTLSGKGTRNTWLLIGGKLTGSCILPALR